MNAVRKLLTPQVRTALVGLIVAVAGAIVEALTSIVQTTSTIP